MSNFGAKLEELMERNKLRAADVARASGLKETLLSRLVNGSQKFVSHEALEAITAVISSKPTEQAELIRAHLLDENVGAGSHLIEIHVLGSGTELRDAPSTPRIVPPLKIQRALELLGRESVTDADVRTILLSMASLLEPKGQPNSDTVDEAKVESAFRQGLAEVQAESAAGAESRGSRAPGARISPPKPHVP